MQYKRRNPLSIRCSQQETDLAERLAATRGTTRHYVLVEAFRVGLAVVATRHGFDIHAADLTTGPTE